MIRIFVDSSADFEPQELERLQLECIPLPVMFGETVYQENVNLTKDEFYRLLTTSSDFPHTSRPTPHDLSKRLKQARDNGDDTIIITLSSALSGTYQDIVMAARNCHYDRCFVIDSRNATGGIRLLAEYAAQLRDEDETAEDIVTAVKALRKLKTQNGDYIWQPSVQVGEPDKLLGRPLYTSSYMPALEAGAKGILFGDLGYYWVADRQGRTFKRLNELYAPTGQVGFLSSERVDGKLILPEAVKCLQMKAAT